MAYFVVHKNLQPQRRQQKCFSNPSPSRTLGKILATFLKIYIIILCLQHSVRDSPLCGVVGANFMISRSLYRCCSHSRSISQIISVWLTIPNSWSTTFIKPALKLSCVERVTSESFSCCRLLTVSWDFSLMRDRLTRTAIFCTLNDRLQSVNHRKFLFSLKALFFDVKIN